eukprot:UN31827
MKRKQSVQEDDVKRVKLTQEQCEEAFLVESSDDSDSEGFPKDELPINTNSGPTPKLRRLSSCKEQLTAKIDSWNKDLETDQKTEDSEKTYTRRLTATEMELEPDIDDIEAEKEIKEDMVVQFPINEDDEITDHLPEDKTLVVDNSKPRRKRKQQK